MAGVNPFNHNQPTPVDHFVGRKQLIDNLLTDLCRYQADSCAVIGGKSFGKSSVLKKLESCLLELWNTDRPEFLPVFPCVVNMKGCEKFNERNIYYCILWQLSDRLESNPVATIDLPATGLPNLLRYSNREVSNYEFEKALRNVVGVLEDEVGPCRLALLLDDGERVAEEPWADTMFSNLRYLVFDSSIADMIKVVITGSARVLQVRDQGSPLLSSVNIYHLDTLPEGAIGQIVDWAGPLPAQVRQAVLTEAGGHPFLAQYLLFHLWRAGIENATTEKVVTFSREFRQLGHDTLLGWWQAVGDSGRIAYAVMCQDQQWFHEGELLEKTTFCEQPLTTGLNALCYHGVACRSEDRSQYQVTGNLFHEWFQTSGIQAATRAAAQVDKPDSEVLNLYGRVHHRLGETDLILLSEATGIRIEDLNPGGISAQLLDLMLKARARNRLPIMVDTLAKIRPDIEL